MSIELIEYERGASFSGDADAALALLRERLARVQLLQLAHRQRIILIFEGAEGAGKTALLRQLGTALDPRFFTVCTFMSDRRRQSEGHWLARFWAALPEAGRSTVYFHSWYRRVLDDRVKGLVAEKDWRRAFDEINEFEAQQRDYGTLVIKLFLHATDDTCDRRIAERLADPLTAVLVEDADMRTPEARAAYRTAVEQMFEQNHTRWSPWQIVDSNDDHAGMIDALTAIADIAEKALPDLPVADVIAPVVATRA